MKRYANNKRHILPHAPVWILLFVFLQFVLLIPGLTVVSCFAMSEIDPDDEDCSICLQMTFRETGQEHVMSGGEMSLYTVGAAALGDTGYYFDTSAGRFSGTAEADMIPGLDSKELSEQNADLARRLSAYTSSMEADRTATIENGEAAFTGLRPGLYLIVMTKADSTGAKVTPFLMSVPDESGNCNIKAQPKPEIEPRTTPLPTPVPTLTPPPLPSLTPPAPTPAPEPTGKPGELPYTGQLWWPVPVLLAAGILLVAAGIVICRKKSGSGEE